MKKHFTISLLAVIIAFVIGVASCKKDTTAANLAFVGTYYGLLSYDANSGGGTGPDTVKVTAGSSANQIAIADVADSIFLTGTVSGNSITNLSGSSPAGYGCISEIYNGTGSLSGSTLTYNLLGTYSCTPGGTGTDTVSYTGVKH